MAIRFIDSCAHYNGTTINRKWTNANSITWNSSGGRRNAPYVTCISVAKTLTQTGTWALGAAFANGNNVGMLVTYNNATVMGSLAANSDSTISVYCNNNKIWTSTLAVSDPSAFHYYEVFWAFSGGTNTCTLTGTTWVDGDLWGTYSGVGNFTGAALINGQCTANQVGIAANSPISFMDFYAIDTAGTDINGFTTTNTANLGDVEVDALFPDADVTTQWGTFGGDGTHAYSCVNETSPDDDTSYVTTTLTGSNEAFNYQPISTFTGTIFGVQYLVCAKKAAEGSREIAMYVNGTNANTSNFLSTANYLSDYYVYFMAPMDSLFGTAWSTSNFNSGTFGVNLLA